MTLSARNRVLLAGIIISPLLVAVVSVLTAYARGVTMSGLVIEGVQYWWMTYREYPAGSGLWFRGLIGVPVFPWPRVTCQAILQKDRFVRDLLFIIFLLSISTDGYVSVSSVRGLKIPPYFGMVLTRLNYLGNFMGLFALFASSLYAMNIQYRNSERYSVWRFSWRSFSRLRFRWMPELYRSLYKVGFEGL